MTTTSPQGQKDTTMTTTPNQKILRHKITDDLATIEISDRRNDDIDMNHTVIVDGTAARLALVMASYDFAERNGASLFVYGERTVRFYAADPDSEMVALHLDTPDCTLVIHIKASLAHLLAAISDAQTNASERLLTNR